MGIGGLLHFGLQKYGHFKLNNLRVADLNLPLLIFMKLKFTVSIIVMMLGIVSYSQQPFCADSSVRVRYIFGSEGASLFNYPDTSGRNVFTGYFFEGPNTGIALLKTDWGDSMTLARKIYVNGKANNSFVMPDGSIIFSGYWGTVNNTDLLISRLYSDGTVQWIKRYKLSQNHLRYSPSDLVKKNILVTNNAIYVNGVFLNTALVGYNTIAKFDLDGNIKWSNAFLVNYPKGASVINAPVLYNNTVIFAANYNIQVGSTLTNFLTVLTRLNDNDGSLIETEAIRITDTDTIGFNNTHLNINQDNSLSLTGNLILKYPFGIGFSNIIFNTLIDKDFNPLHSFFYRNNILLPGDLNFAYNNQKQHAMLGTDDLNLKDKYLSLFDQNDDILRTRKFVLPSNLSSINQTSVNIDDKENLHFLFHYPQSSQLVTEYARISNFAPDGTLGCFGKDTSILTHYSLSLAKEPFTWDNVLTDLITSIDVPYTEDTAIVTKQLVCKMVSYCDSVHINGPTIVCINQPVRYTVTKNAACLKSLQWNIDTAIATIVSTEADTAITLSFKQAFTGYIHAAVYNCVVNDSFFVTVVQSPLVKIINPDSLLCPGKSIILNTTAGFSPYLWQDGSNTQNYTVSTIGFYKITATSFCAVQSSDSIVISLADTSLVITPTQTICKYDTAFISLPPDIININWQPNNNISLNNKTLVLYPLQNTIYTITAERLANCPVSRTSEVLVKNCAKYIFVPNAFSPNNDGVNDIFRAIPVRSPESFLLTIYNRYGQKLFETTDPSSGWDGNYGGKPQPAGGYAYHCSYRFAGDLERAESGYFILIR